MLLAKVRGGLAIFFAAPIRLNFLGLANYCSLLMNRLRLRTGQDFLKPQIIAQRVPFPACPQIGKRDAFIGVIAGKWSLSKRSRSDML